MWSRDPVLTSDWRRYGMSGLVGALAVTLGFSLMAGLEVVGGHSHGGHGHGAVEHGVMADMRH